MRGLASWRRGALVTGVAVALVVGAAGQARAASDTTPPSMPGNVRMSANTETTITLAWNASTDNVGVDRYRIYRDGTVVGNAQATSSPTFTDKGLWSGATHGYTLDAVDAAGNVSARSVRITAYTRPDTTPPTPPTNLVATFVKSPLKVALTWGASTDNVKLDHYTVFRDLVAIGSVDVPTTTFVDTTVPANVTVKYLVVASDAFAYTSASSNQVVVQTDTKPPSAPTNAHATATTASSISLAWTASTDNFSVASYDIYRDGVKIANQSWTTGTTFYSGGLAAGTTYSYTIVARDPSGNVSPPSGAATATTSGGDLQPPSAPSVVTAMVSAGAVWLAWTPSTDNRGVKDYVVRRNGVVVAVRTTLAWIDATAPPNIMLRYTVQARDAAGNRSVQSKAASAMVDTLAPSAPANVHSALTGADVSLSWSPANDNVAVQKYAVIRDGVVLASTRTTTYTDTTGTERAALVYKIVAIDEAGNRSPPSDEAAIPVPAASGVS